MTKNDRAKKKAEDAIRKAFQQSIANMKGAKLSDLIKAIEAKDIDAAIKILKIDRTSLSALETELNNAYYSGAELVVDKVGNVQTKVGNVLFQFDYRSAAAERWVAEYSSKLIQEVTEEQKSLVRLALEKEIAAGTNPRTAALSLVGKVDPVTGSRVGGMIGLHPTQSQWLGKAWEELNNLDPRYLTRGLRDPRFDSMVKKAIVDGVPLTDEQIRTIMARMEARTLKYRGDVIARTESINALRAGQHEGIKQAVEMGEVDQQDVMKEWDATMDSRTRDSHADMDGEQVGIDEPFNVNDSLMMYPGDTSMGAAPEEVIQCRCRVSYKIDFIGKAVRMEKL